MTTQLSRGKKLLGATAAICAGALILAACGGGGGNTTSKSSGGQSKAEPTWSFGAFTPKGDAGFDYMAQQQGYYKQQGVKVDFKTFSGSVQLTQAIISGALDSGEVSPASVYDAVAKGAPLKIIGSTLPGLAQNCYAPKSITSFSQLKGKPVGVSAPGALPQVIAEAFFVAKGVDPSSMKIVNAGGDAQRMKALYAGRIDLACGSPEYVPKLPAGFHVLGAAPKLTPDFPREVFVANTNSLKKKPDAVVKFMAAQMKGIRYALDHKNAEVKLAAKKTSRPASDPSLSYYYDTIKKAGTASPTMEIPMKKLEWLQNFRLQHGLQKQKVDLNKLTDGSYRANALKLVNGS
ncbi:MAG: ABC transporter substrate-binding protein [Sciscionella sp.]